MKVLILIALIANALFASEKPKDDTYKRIMLGAAIATTWTSIGISEGQKWKQNKTGDIDLFWKEDYHLYRSVTSLGLISIPVIALTIDDKNMKENLKTAVIGNLIGWGMYECVITSIYGGSLTHSKENFTMLGTNLTLPSPVMSLLSSIALSAVIKYSF